MAENQNKEGQIKIEIAPEVATGTYANLAVITHSNTEMVLDFISALPGAPASVKNRIIMVPENAKRLLMALAENVQKYEAQFGTIELGAPAAPADGRTANPFGAPEGQA